MEALAQFICVNDVLLLPWIFFPLKGSIAQLCSWACVCLSVYMCVRLMVFVGGARAVLTDEKRKREFVLRCPSVY